VLKAQNPDIVIWAVEPENAAILAGGTIGTHLQMGIGDGLIPENLNTSIYDEGIYRYRRGSDMYREGPCEI
jgi:cysteine synthase A